MPLNRLAGYVADLTQDGARRPKVSASGASIGIYDADGTTLHASIPTSRQVVNVRDVVGYSETADLAVAVRDVINANPGKTIVLEGTFMLGTSMAITASDVRIVGAGGNTILQGLPTNPGVSLEITGNDVTIEGLTLLGTGTRDTWPAGGAGRGLIRTGTLTSGATVSNCRFFNADASALTLQGSRHAAWGNVIVNPNEHGIYVSQAADVAVTGNVILECGSVNTPGDPATANGNSIKVANASGVTLNGNVCRTALGTNILLDSTVSTTAITGGVCIGGNSGIRLRPLVSGAVISGVTITEYEPVTVPGQAAVRIEGTGARMSGCVIGAGPQGIRFFGTASNNDCRGNLIGSTTKAIMDGTGNVWADWNSGSTRPTLVAADAGYQFYDTGLSRPIWWTGSQWRDAAGVAV